MSAATIRRAATLMHSRAQAVIDNANRYPEDTGGPEACYAPAFIEDAFRKHAPIDPPYSDGCEQAWEAEGDYLAAMTPQVGVAVADWLDHEAGRAELAERFESYDERHFMSAITIARAYLGGAA